MCPAKKNPITTTTVSPIKGGASPRNGECVDSPDCEENGIVDIIGCDFTDWANDKCPKTCGTCGLSTRSDDSEEDQVEFFQSIIEICLKVGN